MNKFNATKLLKVDWVILTLLSILFLLMINNMIIKINILNSNQSSTIASKSLDKVAFLIGINVMGFFIVFVSCIYYVFKSAKLRSSVEAARLVEIDSMKQNLIVLDELYNKSPIGFHSADASGLIIEMNKTELDWLGYTKGEVVNKMYLSELSSRDKNNLNLLMNTLLKTDKLNNVVGSLRKKDGSAFLCFSNSTILRDDAGNVSRIKTAVIDYSKQKELDDAIIMQKQIAEDSNINLLQKQIEVEQNMNFFKNIYDNSPIGFNLSDNDGTILEMNATELEWLGYSYKEVIGKLNIKDILVDCEKYNYDLQQLKENHGKLDNSENELKRKDGTIFPIISNMKAEIDNKGSIVNVRTVSFDFTEKMTAQKTLLLAQLKIESSHQMMEQFISNISHEIRTPLNAIIGFSRLLKNSGLNEHQLEYTSNINLSSENLLRIVNHVLDYSKLDSGLINLEEIAFSPASLGDSLFHMFSFHAIEKRLKFNIELDPKLPNLVIGDPTRLTQILINLIGNALKFTEDGFVILRIGIVTESDNNIVISYEVEDTGIGIPDEMQTEIFERFKQGSSETTRIYGGTGLGLSITKQLVELLGGKVDIASAVGSGSTFKVELTHKLVNVDKNTKGIYEISPEILTERFSGKILVVEDNMMNKRLLELILKDLHIDADFVNNGKLALEILKLNSYKLILMDIQMPVMDGYTTAAHIRNDLKLDTPIIAATAHAFIGEKEKCLKLGMNDYISKPIDTDVLHKLIVKYRSEKNLPKNLHDNQSATLDQVIFDKGYILKITGGNKEVLKTLALAAIEESKLEYENMQRALGQQDYKSMATACHSMRNTFTILGSKNSISAILKDIETECRHDLPNYVDILKSFEELSIVRDKTITLLYTEYIDYR